MKAFMNSRRAHTVALIVGIVLLLAMTSMLAGGWSSGLSWLALCGPAVIIILAASRLIEISRRRGDGQLPATQDQG